MLVLSRKRGERIFINDEIIVSVEAVMPNGAVRLGIEAPRDVPVHREEVKRRIEASAKKSKGGDAK